MSAAQHGNGAPVDTDATAGPDRPIFVDPTGRRRWIVCLTGHVLASVTGLCLALLGSQAIAPSTAPAPWQAARTDAFTNPSALVPALVDIHVLVARIHP